MASVVQQLLISARVEKIRQQKAKIPQKPVFFPRNLEYKYSIKLRRYQREINQELMQVLEPLITTYKRQDATTRQIEDTMDRSAEAITAAIMSGAALSNIIITQGQDISKWNIKKYSAPIYLIAGFNAVPGEHTTDMLTSWTVENVKLIKGINDDQIKKIETLLLRADRNLMEPGDLRKTIQQIMGSTVKRATLIARDQSLKLNGQLDRLKQTNAGVDRYVWRTSRDERVRPEHRAREGKVYSWNEHPQPGEEVQCRCSAEPDFSTILGPDFAPEGPQSIKPYQPKRKKK